jgi:hypothetical protein
VTARLDHSAFPIFAATLDGAPPAIATKNMNDLLLFCGEFGLASLLCQVTTFISAHSVVGGELRNRVSDLEEKNRQQNRKHWLLQKGVVELRETNKAEKEEIATIGRVQAKSDKEKSELRAQFAREQANDAKEHKMMKREIAALGR